METISLKNKDGVIKMNNAITAKDIMRNDYDGCYFVQEKPMKVIYKEKIDEIQEMIDKVEIGKDGRLKQLSWKKGNLEMAFLRCLNN